MGTYRVSETDSNSLGDDGTWTCTLTVAVQANIGVPAFRVPTTRDSISGFTLQREEARFDGPTVFTVTGFIDDLTVSNRGSVSTAAKLGMGTDNVSGTDVDCSGETVETTSYLTVTV